MANITTSLIKELRIRTGVGIMECKSALFEAKGDIELAINNMRKSGIVKAAKKANNITTEGIIITKIAQNNKYGSILELNCETDFVAKSQDFKSFGEEIIVNIINEQIFDIKIVKDKFEKKRVNLVSKIGENINIRRLGILKGNLVGSYMHGTSIGVIISGTNINNDLIKHIAMHIAAMTPEYIKIDDIPSSFIENEYKIQLEIVKRSGKPDIIAKKIVEGRMCKFLNNISLINQHFILDNSQTVGQLLSEHNAKINQFIRFKLGESI